MQDRWETLHLPDASGWSVLQESNRSGWLINNHFGGWRRGGTSREQWTIKSTLIPFVSLSRCLCAALTPTYLLIPQPVCCSVEGLRLPLGASVFVSSAGFNEGFHEQVPSVHISLCLSAPTPYFSFTGIVFILTLTLSWQSVGRSDITPPTGTAAGRHTHPHSRWCTIYSAFHWTD